MSHSTPPEPTLLLEVLLEAVADGVAVLDCDLVVVRWSAGAEALTGISTSEAMGRPGWEIQAELRDTSGTDLRDTWEQLRTSGSTRVTTHDLQRRDGARRHVRTRLVPVQGGLVLIMHDLTPARHRLRLEEELARARRLEAIGRLAGGVAHDFNNALTPILGSTEFASELLPQEHPVQTELDEIRVAAQDARELVSQLLAFGRRAVLRMEVLHLNDLIRGWRSMLTRLVSPQVRIHLDLHAHPDTVLADPSQLRRALIALAANADDAMPHGGTLRLATRHLSSSEVVHAGSLVLLTIQDDGMGFDADTLANIFEPFFDPGTGGRASGLGLATVYGVVKQHGGHITARSQPGTGTTFEIYLPEVGRVPKPHNPDKPEVRTGARVLLVDDETSVRRLVGRLLRRAGFEVVEAADGVQGLEVGLRELHGLDLLLTDVIMPGLDGRELYDALTARRPDLPVLFISGYSEERIAPRGVLQGGMCFLPKPFTSAELLQAVSEALQGTEE